MMTSKERVLRALKNQKTDRIPVKHEGTPEVNQMIRDYFGLTNDEQLLQVVGDDFRYVEPVYTGPELKSHEDGSIDGYWGERYTYVDFGEGKYLESVYQPFAGITNPADLDESKFPTAEMFDYSTIKDQCLYYKDYAVCFGTAGDMDFINSIARARGTEQVLIDLITDDPVYLKIMDARFKFYYEMHERALQAADGLIDIMHIGEDLGTQTAPVIGMDIFEKHFAPKFEKYFKMVHSYGAKTMMHMCGCVDAFLQRLSELGLDIYDVVQPTTEIMDIGKLKEKHGDYLNFCGSMCVQSTLAFGSKEEVEKEVKRRLSLFANGGLILGPTHAIQVGSPIENIIALYKTAGSLMENPGKEIMEAQPYETKEGVNMSKLF